MCGISGLFTSSTAGSERIDERVQLMNSQLVHRGPDDDGQWADPPSGIALGFRRLAILDLSMAGHQPMKSGSGRYMMVFNGEVYNFRALRDELESLGYTFQGHSDTEVILAAFERWGIEKAVLRFVGMFAIAIWDNQERALTLVRDRMGIKPLYYHCGPGWVSFASELKALRADPEFRADLDWSTLGSYFRYLCVPAPATIYRDTYKLLPGHLLTIRNPGDSPTPITYWSVTDVAERGQTAPQAQGPEMIDGLEAVLKDAVGLRMEADVPLGAFLSGGVDSATVTALMQSQAHSPVKTYAIGFDYQEHDETRHADAVARHLGTDHTEFRVSGQDALDVIPSIPDMFDEPLADPSQIPTYLVSKLARQEVTVALTGDGGDEVFAGYNRYRYGADIMRRWGALPRWIRAGMVASIRALPPARWDGLGSWMSPVLGGSGASRLLGTKLHKVAELLDQPHAADQYQSLQSAWQQPERLAPGAPVSQDMFRAAFDSGSSSTLEERMMAADQSMYLPDDLLAKVDRASMAVSLEARVPLLDHRVVEHAWQLPLAAKIGQDGGKWILRQVLYRYVPRPIVDRPKVGFTVPLAEWLRGPLREWAEDLLDPGKLEGDGVLASEPIRDEWRSLQDGTSANALRLWTVLMFQAWRDRWLP